MKSLRDWLSPRSWEEIEALLTPDAYEPFHGKLPEGRTYRDYKDKAGQVGDILQHGNTYVRWYGYTATTGTSSCTHYTISGITTTVSSTITFNYSGLTSI